MKLIICPIILFFSLISYAQTDEYSITNLSLNNEFPHFGLMQFGEGKVLFTSYLVDKKGKVKRYQGEPSLGVFQGTLDGAGGIISIEPLTIDPKQNKSHITSATISPDGKQLYITIRYTNKTKPKGDFNMNNFHLEVAEYKEGIGWTNFNVLPFCKPRYSYAHPTLSKDGKTLYFTANFRGGKETTKGGSDIFKVEVLGNNSYSEPKNLGSMVNSYSREMFPYLTEENTLYFASNRPGGFGGYDIYKSIIGADGAFTKAKKLPKPLNSNKDDFSLIMTVSGAAGYLVSKRIKGKGDDDIYFFKKN